MALWIPLLAKVVVAGVAAATVASIPVTIHRMVHGNVGISQKFEHVPGIFEFGKDPKSRIKVGFQCNHSWDIVQDILEQAGGDVKLLLLVRHGQGYHNYLSSAARRTFDQAFLSEEKICKDMKGFGVELTPKGMHQAQKLNSELRRHNFLTEKTLMRHNVSFVTSPLRRAVQTAGIALDGLLGNATIQWHLEESCREHIGPNLCDARRALDVRHAEDASSSMSHDVLSAENICANDYQSIRDSIRETLESIQTTKMEFHAKIRQAEEDDRFGLDAVADIRFEEKESWKDVGLRSERFIERVFKVSNDSNIVFVSTHSHFISSALQMLGLPYYHPSNAELIPVLVRDKRT